MEFFEDNEICWWAKEHGLRGAEGFRVELPDLPAHPRQLYASGGRSGAEAAAAADLVARLGSWDECLVWIRSWGVWASGEDWPEFYSWRGAMGERRSLDVAPGHRFDSNERDRLTELLGLVMKNAWDADVLCASQGHADKLRAKISHDEWFQLFGDL